MRIILFLLFNLFCTGLFVQGMVSKHGHLKVNGIFLEDQKDEKVTLHGVSLGWSNEHSRFYNESVVAWLKKDWKISAIRATVGIEPVNGYLDNPLKTTSQITQVIDGAIKNDIYVVVAWHCNNMHLSQSKEFFTGLAKKYGDHPNVIYEIFTEPDNETWAELKTYYRELIKAIRAIDQDNIILISAPYWTQHIKEVADDPFLEFSNVMYTVHFCVGDSGQSLLDDCEYAMKKGVPIMVSDHLLTNCSCDGNLLIEEWEKWISWFQQNSISWMAWSISDKKEACSMLLPSASSQGNWTLQDLSESGKIVRDKLINMGEDK